MGAFENQCSEMNKQDIIDMLGRALDREREATRWAEEMAKAAGIFKDRIAELEQQLATIRARTIEECADLVRDHKCPEYPGEPFSESEWRMYREGHCEATHFAARAIRRLK